MTTIFRSRIRHSLADKNLQAALDANAERRIQGRKIAFESLPNPEATRRRAHLIRAEVVEHLDEYLREFIDHAQHNGMQVHRAANADQAVQLVLEIASSKGARLIAKSKTMVSEEIRLNHELEAHSYQVVETDLGEYIVQLRGEAPSHIITPAVHLRRQDVGRLFQEKLGVPYTEDISLMTNTARQVLRQVFLDADIGISGVNFGVAESGTLCVVTNEGNGRMVTTVPRTHIALMGMERLVPTMDDLALMLLLLPRSATGQKLSVYTSLLNGPLCQEDADGPLERHIILVDNGRSKVQQSELREILYCIRCGACLNVCPVFREIGGHAYVSQSGEGSPYPGPMGSVVSPALFGQREFGHLARASSLCGACREACPVDIDLPKLLLRIRAGYGTGEKNSKPNSPGWLKSGIDVFTLAATSPRRFHAAQWFAGVMGIVSSLANKGKAWVRLPAWSGWGYSKDFPRPASRPFHTRISAQYQDIPTNVATIAQQGKQEAGKPADGEMTSLEEDHLTRFTREAEALGVKVTKCDPHEVLHAILDILQHRGIEEILTWDSGSLPGGILDQIQASGIKINHPNRESFKEDSHIQAGLTGACAGIANTGSILLVGGQGKALTTSLLPEVHIALLHEKDIHAELSSVLQLGIVKQASAGVLITGPSRTADIEMTLTIGVHGPGELHVLCILD